MVKRLIVFLAIFGLILAPVSNTLAEEPEPMFSGPPESLEDVKTMFSRALGVFPAGVKAAFDWAKSFWRQLFQKLRSWWEANLADKFLAWAKSIWQKTKELFFKRGAIFKEEFGKEKTEMEEDIKKEIPKWWEKFWEKFKEIIK
ncbi:MAG: hypothetical protein Q8N16_00485 [bacterium]|nr:hypothetical protein [bacterium]